MPKKTNQAEEKLQLSGIACEHQLRVPLHTDDEACARHLHAFDDAVGGPGHRLQSGRQVLHRLVMIRVDLECIIAQEISQPAGRLQPDEVTSFSLRPLMDQRVGHLVGDVLDQAASQGHIENLNSPADGQQRPVSAHPFLHQCQLEVIPLPVNLPRLGVAVLAEQVRGHVAAPAEEEAVQDGKEIGDRLRLGRQADRHSSRLLHSRHVSLIESEICRTLARGRLLEGHGHTDDRSHS